MQRILEVQLQEKKERAAREQAQNRQIHENMQMQAEAYKHENEMNAAARKDLMMDYRRFLDQQKWGNQVMKEKMNDEEFGVLRRIGGQ